jgi:hypothetical protein
MIRWYDWVAAILVADITQSFLIVGTNSATWWEIVLYGLLAGMTVKVWEEQYCHFRLKQERNRGK